LIFAPSLAARKMCYAALALRLCAVTQTRIVLPVNNKEYATPLFIRRTYVSKAKACALLALSLKFIFDLCGGKAKAVWGVAAIDQPAGLLAMRLCNSISRSAPISHAHFYVISLSLDQNASLF
jgi:hypothetical protein